MNKTDKKTDGLTKRRDKILHKEREVCVSKETEDMGIGQLKNSFSDGRDLEKDGRTYRRTDRQTNRPTCRNGGDRQMCVNK